jgi:hypothetical protein
MVTIYGGMRQSRGIRGAPHVVCTFSATLQREASERRSPEKRPRGLLTQEIGSNLTSVAVDLGTATRWYGDVRIWAVIVPRPGRVSR